MEKIEAQLNSEDYSNAVTGLTALKEKNPIQEETLLSGYRERLYNYGVECYRSMEFSIAEDTFDLLGVYKQSGDYLFLSGLTPSRNSGSLSVDLSESDFQRLKQLAGFEDAGDYLVQDNAIACRFLEGYWSGGAAYIRLYTQASTWWAVWELTGIPSSSWWFDKGEFYISDSNGDEIKAAKITVTGANSITLYVYSTGKTYDLVRN